MLHKRKKLSPIRRFIRDQQMGARRGLLEEMFNDFYQDRYNIYWMNFIRGIFFGLGSVLGGTLVVAVVLWVLSLFVSLPWIGQSLEQAQQTIQQSEQHKQ